MISGQPCTLSLSRHVFPLFLFLAERDFERDEAESRMKEEENAGTHTRDVVVGAHALLQQAISNLPREDRRTLALVDRDLADDLRGGYARFTAADRPGPYGSGLIVPATIIFCGTIR